MPIIKKLQIRTVIVDGDASSFKASLTRSILGVTYLKFKKRKDFFQHQTHNQAVTQSIINWLYESLLVHIKNTSAWKLKTELTPNWDESGKINAISEATVSVYMKVGELKVKELRVCDDSKTVRLDLFYTETDFGSKKLRAEIPGLIKAVGVENFEFYEHDFSSENGREIGKSLNVVGTPTVTINCEKKLENPSEKELCREIQKAFGPTVKSTIDPMFEWDAKAFTNAQVLYEMQTILKSK